MAKYENYFSLCVNKLPGKSAILHPIPFDEFYGYIKTQNLQEAAKKVFEESMDKYV